MKRKDREQLKAMSADELESELKKRHDELFKMTFGQTATVVKNALRERTLRREIAAIYTWLGQSSQAGKQGAV